MNPMRVLRSFVVTAVAFVVFAAPAVVLADGPRPCDGLGSRLRLSWMPTAPS